MPNKPQHTGWPTPEEYKSWYEHHELKPSEVDSKDILSKYYWNADPDKCTWIFTPEEYSDLYKDLRKEPNLPPSTPAPINPTIHLPGGKLIDSKFFPNEQTINKQDSAPVTINDINIIEISEEEAELLPAPATTVISSIALMCTVCIIGCCLCDYFLNTDYDG